MATIPTSSPEPPPLHSLSRLLVERVVDNPPHLKWLQQLSRAPVLQLPRFEAHATAQGFSRRQLQDVRYRLHHPQEIGFE